MKTIKFSHITKTAGTTIESIAWLNNINWGYNEAEFWRKLIVFSKYEYVKSTPAWHWPISFCKNKKLLNETLLKYRFFTVVRNPYDRCISEYYCEYGGPEIKSTKKKDFNYYIKKKLIDVKNFKFTSGHFIPQFFYVYEKNYEKIIKDVLKYENIETEFNSFMKKYNYKLRFSFEKHSSIKRFKQCDFEEKTIKLIQEVYYKDFIFFNYNLEPNSIT